MTIDLREPAAIGRSARLELVFGVRDGRTVLVHGYAEPPLRVGRPLADGDGLHLILATSAPGIFAGDAFVQRIIVEPGARVRLTSQSAMQVHPSTQEEQALLRSTYDVGADATLVCVWDPIIPFAGSRFAQQTEIRLDASARLVWHEAMMAGREGRGERWHFARLRQDLRVSRGDTLEYLERYDVVPATARPDVPWVAGECCYFGTSLAVGSPTDAERTEALHAALNGTDGLSAAVDNLGASVMLARLAASSGPAFHAARERLASALSVQV